VDTTPDTILIYNHNHYRREYNSHLKVYGIAVHLEFRRT